VTEQLFEGVEFVGILVVGIVITRDDVHSDTILTQFLKEVFAVSIQCLEVNKPTMLIVVTKVDDMLYPVLNKMGEEYIRVKPFLIVDKNITAVTDAAVSVI
jgi:hypothetical protein